LFEGLEKIPTDDLRGLVAKLEKEAEQSPWDYLKLNRLAGAYLLLGDYRNARDSYRRVLERKPDLNSARLNLGAVLACLGENDAAVAELQEFVRRDVHSPRAERALRAICSLKNVPYEDALRETRSGALPPPKGRAVHTAGSRSRTMYPPPAEGAARPRPWSAIDVFLLFLIIVAVVAWYLFPAQTKPLLYAALAHMEAPFAFRVTSEEPVENEGEDESAGATSDEEKKENVVVNLNPSTESYLPLAPGNTWNYIAYDTRDPFGGSERDSMGSRRMRVKGLARQEPDIWAVINGDQTIYYVERSMGLYSVQDPKIPWSGAICQIPYPADTGRSVRSGTQTVTVEREEDVRTAAGLFRCIKLRYTEPEPAGLEWRAWYAQGIGLVKYVGGGRLGTYHVLELRDYQIN
jgi:hypothetical protein